MEKKLTQQEIDEQIEALDDLIMSNQLADGPSQAPATKEPFDYRRHVLNKFLTGW